MIHPIQELPGQTLSADLKSIGHAYLGDPAVIAAALQAVANQGKAKIA
jgi:2,3-bisphosphoglycerate-dependent phosphoglycerate mutase